MGVVEVSKVRQLKDGGLDWMTLARLEQVRPRSPSSSLAICMLQPVVGGGTLQILLPFLLASHRLPVPPSASPTHTTRQPLFFSPQASRTAWDQSFPFGFPFSDVPRAER